MGKEKIIIQQVLHGYANGHELLAVSTNLDLDDRKKIDELSDLNGAVTKENFLEYFTGYPIQNGEYYVIAKTWYAGEMKRPGCVWTHSLILDTADIFCIRDLQQFIRLFHRPSDFEYSEYRNPIVLEVDPEAKKRLLPYDSHKLQYAIHTILSTNETRVSLLDDWWEDFSYEILNVVFSLNKMQLHDFMFSSRSYGLRKYNGVDFSYQVFYPEEAFRVKDGVRYYKDLSVISVFPFWVRCYEEYILEDKVKEIWQYIEQYEPDYLCLQNYSKFVRLFFALNHQKMTLTDYFEAMEKVLGEDSNAFQQTIELILDDRLLIDCFKDCEIEILEMMDLGKFKLKKDRKEKLINKILKGDPDKLYSVLKKYIAGELSAEKRDILDSVIGKLEPDSLKKVSRMDENICCVLAYKNYNLLLSKDIWQKPKRFQQALIHAGSLNGNDNLFLKKLLLLIIHEDRENVAEDLYCILGDVIYEPLYCAVCQVGSITELEADKWIPILRKKQSEIFHYYDKLPSKYLRKELFLSVDTYDSDLVSQVPQERWIHIYQDLTVEKSDDGLLLKYAVQFIPVILCAEKCYPDSFVKEVFDPVYHELKNNSLNYEYWSKFQYWLPEVEDCYAWDKCLRVRKALECRGYHNVFIEG